ncbi:hypothetical protein SAMN04488558_103123 [Ignavigranum ruoffiae]|uniref:Uncharacterized protein n=1 Tax=Ignavigranum ruoffiae TaxID=89093 RepID=A0A1H9BXL1_9LACT|nr:hypothetical protein SAMN04488558_103123 [Ignavigranum ruoffiae]
MKNILKTLIPLATGLVVGVVVGRVNKINYEEFIKEISDGLVRSSNLLFEDHPEH